MNYFEKSQFPRYKTNSVFGFNNNKRLFIIFTGLRRLFIKAARVEFGGQK